MIQDKSSYIRLIAKLTNKTKNLDRLFHIKNKLHLFLNTTNYIYYLYIFSARIIRNFMWRQRYSLKY